jgi:hypothetical protein
MLGIAHVGGNNVMNGNVGSALHVDFDAGQVSTILGSNLVQEDAFGRFIVIDPILVTAAAVVPVPGALVLFLSAISSLGLFGRSLTGRVTPA